MTLPEAAIFAAACAVPVAVGYIWFAVTDNRARYRRSLLALIAAHDRNPLAMIAAHDARIKAAMEPAVALATVDEFQKETAK